MPSSSLSLHDSGWERQAQKREVASEAQIPEAKAGGPGVTVLGRYAHSLTDSTDAGDTGTLSVFCRAHGLFPAHRDTVSLRAVMQLCVCVGGGHGTTTYRLCFTL